MISEYDIYSHRLNYYTLYDIHIFYLLLCAQTLHIVLKFMPGPRTRLSVVTDNPNPLHYCRIALLTVPRQYVYVIYLCTASLDVLCHPQLSRRLRVLTYCQFLHRVYAMSTGSSRARDKCLCLCLLVKNHLLIPYSPTQIIGFRVITCTTISSVCSHLLSA